MFSQKWRTNVLKNQYFSCKKDYWCKSKVKNNKGSIFDGFFSIDVFLLTDGILLIDFFLLTDGFFSQTASFHRRLLLADGLFSPHRFLSSIKKSSQYKKTFDFNQIPKKIIIVSLKHCIIVICIWSIASFPYSSHTVYICRQNNLWEKYRIKTILHGNSIIRTLNSVQKSSKNNWNNWKTCMFDGEKFSSCWIWFIVMTFSRLSILLMKPDIFFCHRSNGFLFLKVSIVMNPTWLELFVTKKMSLKHVSNVRF